MQGVVASGARRVAIARAFTDRDGVRVQVRTVHDVAAVTRMKGTRARRATASDAASAASAARDATTPVIVESPESLRPILEDVLVARMPEPAARAAFVNATLAHADEALTRGGRCAALRNAIRRARSRASVRARRRHSPRWWTIMPRRCDAAIDALATRVTPLLSARALRSRGERADGAGTGTGTSADDRLSIMQMFSHVNAMHAETHALLAGGSAAAVASSSHIPTPIILMRASPPPACC